MTGVPERRTADALCPLRPGDGCRMCVPGASGPGDCGLVQLVSCDPDLCAGLERAWAVHEAAAKSATRTSESS